jgi:hypothetical protein
MYVMYYALMLQCWQFVMILVKTNHPCLRVGRHTDHAEVRAEVECNLMKRSHILSS